MVLQNAHKKKSAKNWKAKNQISKSLDTVIATDQSTVDSTLENPEDLNNESEEEVDQAELDHDRKELDSFLEMQRNSEPKVQIFGFDSLALGAGAEESDVDNSFGKLEQHSRRNRPSPSFDGHTKSNFITSSALTVVKKIRKGVDKSDANQAFKKKMEKDLPQISAPALENAEIDDFLSNLAMN